MTMHSNRRRSLALGLVATTLAVVAGGAFASSEQGADYGSPELVQRGYGPAGPPAASAAFVARRATASAGRDYGSAELLQLGHGPAGPRASTGS